ncbi:MAG: hypothetical protein US49_C0010G0035 [candidate division TM6 bacterium GW2011_GWF2_37_49]|nr:MAG: hypothetical protein US49_C0010G0035 [candidate division TM6 bacterium GW2011_GWF2_37_49]
MKFQNRKPYIYLMLSLIFLPACSFFKSNIKEIASLTQVSDVLDKANENTLVVFDMDDTLIAPADNMFHLTWREANDFDAADVKFVKQLRKDFEKIAFSKNDPDYLNKFRAAVFAKTQFNSAEPGTVSIVKNLQSHGVKVIALTSSNTGRFVVIESMQKWRQSNLNQVGLNFSTSFELQEASFYKLEKMFGFYPVFYKGILCAAGNPKGKALAAFIEKVGWTPSNVIFFDDGYHHCKSVASEMKKLGIPVKCFWYKAACQTKIKLNHEVVRYQFNHWVEREEFLTDEKALIFLHH